ncbi:Fc.00g036560.m01.CDS01 [Cosmosporella sp. VM-42]
MGFRITTWNVNGIRNPFGYQPWREKRTFQAMFDILEADILIMQETKIQRKDLRDDMVLVPGWDVFFSLPKHKKGYSGVAIYTRNGTCSPIRAEEGVTGILCSPKSMTRFRDLPPDQRIGGYPRPGQLDGTIDEATLDSEGRCVILEFPAFVLFGVYSPANRDQSRQDFRNGFIQALDVRIRNLVSEGKQVILTGDLNIIRSEIDSTNVAESLRKEGMTMEDWMSVPARRTFNQLIFEGDVIGGRDEGREEPVLWDLCRCFHPGREGMNTCWDTKRNTRPANNGSRIDYILCSDGIKDWFDSSNIQEGLMGSDHCPVFATLLDKVTVEDKERSLLELMNPPGVFRDGQRTRNWGPKDLLPLSAKLIPEFDRRQSIRDMFTKKPGPQQPSASLNPSTKTPNTDSSDDPSTPQSNSNDSGSQTGINTVLSDRSARLNAGGDNLLISSQLKSQPLPKRPVETPEVASTRSLKRSRSAASGNDSKSKVAVGQMTLQGFFKPKASASQPGKPALGGNIREAKSPAKPSGPSAKATSSVRDTLPSSSRPEASPQKLANPESDRVFDPIEAKESWSKLLSKRVAPRCEHNEPCISLTTKKPGVNCGK